jgi:prepilin-type N-terminal cleavage/methylation domain-containing protein
MPRRSCGFTLVEVLVSLLVLAAGLLPVVYGVGAGIALARRGTARSRAALTLMSRLTQLQQASMGGRSGCQWLVSGSSGSGGILESWTVTGSDSVRSVVMRAGIPLPGSAVAESARVRIPCG